MAASRQREWVRRWAPPVALSIAGFAYLLLTPVPSRAPSGVGSWDGGGGPWDPRQQAGPDVARTTLHGRVQEVGGPPIAGAGVWLLDPASPVMPVDVPGSSLGIGPAARTDGDGRFRIDRVPVQDVLLRVVAGGPFVVPPDTAVPADAIRTRVVVTVQRGTPIRLTIVDADDRPVPGATIELWQATTRTQSSWGATGIFEETTREDGSADLPALDTRRDLRLTVHPPEAVDDLLPVERDRWVPASGRVGLPRAFSVRVTVRDDEGRPLRAKVERAQEEDEPPGSLPPWNWVTDDSGVVTIRRFPHGPVRLRAVAVESAAVFPGTSSWLRVTPEAPQVAFVLPHVPRILRIRTVGSPGLRHGLIAALRDGEDPPTRGFWTGEDGTAQVDAIAYGDYSLLLLGEHRPGALAARVDRFRFDGHELTVPLVPAARIRVRVRGPADAPDGTPWIRLHGRTEFDLVRMGEGIWERDGFPPGRYDVVARAARGGREWEAVAEVEAGGDAAELVLRPK